MPGGSISKRASGVAHNVAHGFSHAKHVAVGAVSHGAHFVGEAVADTAHIVGDAVDDVRHTVVPSARVPQELIDAETPEDRWFTPSAGWPAAPAPLHKPDLPKKYEHWSPPHNLCPTAAEAPFLFDGGGKIGELRVEVLEAEHLPRLVQLGRVDPYVLVVFESFAGRTSGHSNDRNPQWGIESPRAFRFPVSCPYSLLHIAVMDDDRGTDDPVGRVVVDLGQLCQRTVYDGWWPLQYGIRKRHAHKRGLLRLRLSVAWRSDRIRLLSFFKPPPTFVVPFIKSTWMKESQFALRGRRDPTRFKWSLFKSYCHEMEVIVDGFLQVISKYVFWEYPVASAVVLIMYQIIVMNPFMLPAALFLFLLSGLAQAAISKKYQTGIDAQPPLKELCLSVIRGGNTAPLTSGPEEEDSNDESEGSSDDDDPHKVEEHEKEKAAAAAAAAGGAPAAAKPSSPRKTAEQLLPKRWIFGTSKHYKPTLQEELERLKFEEEHPEFNITSLFNLSKALTPVHVILYHALIFFRMFHRIIAWTDQGFTLLLSFTLGSIAVALTLVGWLLAFLPWGWIIEWFFRIAGFALLGPHMYWVGKHVKAKREKAMQEELEFFRASDHQRQVILAQHKKALAQKAKEELEKEARKHQASRLNVPQAELDKYTMLPVRPFPVASKLRYHHRPLGHRSNAYPRFPSEDRPPIAATEP